MKKTLSAIILLLVISTSAMSHNTGGNRDSTRIHIENLREVPLEVRKEIYRTFEGLNTAEPLVQVSDPIIVTNVVADSVQEKRNHAHSLLDKVLSGQRFLESLDAMSEIELPVGIVKSGGAIDYSILIDRINFTPQGATMEVYVSLELPQSGDRIAFNGKIPLSREGGIAGIARVSLVGDHHLKLSPSILLTIMGTDRTYVEFDCNGFKGISLEAEVTFSRDLIVPEDEKGNRIENDQRVKVKFITYAQSLNDLLVGITIPPFQVNSLKDFGFEVTKAFLDFSDLANPPGLVFPRGYNSPFLQAGSPNLWQGFSLQQLTVRLPASFASRNNNQRVTIGVENMIIDDLGFTGEVFAENLIEAGDMNGWSYTLDRIELGLVANQITGFQLAGDLSVPVIKNKEGKPSQFGYLAQRGADGNYIFAVSVGNDLKMPLWAADVKLFTGSSVTIAQRDNTFYPKASLNGEMTINILDKGPKTKFNSIRFERMVISSEAPHFTPGSFGFGREGENSTVSKYPVVFSNISVKSEADRVGLGFDLTINIGGKPEEEGFGGTASLIVWGKQKNEPVLDGEGQVIGSAKENWQFDKIDLSGVKINIEKKNAYKLEGSIAFYSADPVYGDGFSGKLKGSISSFGGIEAMSLFGQTESFRYWYADALVSLKTPGVPLIPGALFATGFGGGFYYKMKQTDKYPGSSYGETKSGIYYVPDENTLGIKAIMNVGTARPEAMNGDVGLEVIMNRHGGINSVTLTGNANFMSLAAMGEGKMKELAKAGAAGKLSEKLAGLMKGQLFGNMKLHFDNVNDVFHGNLEIYVNVAGGIVRGVGPGNKAGWAVLHFEKTDWYVLIGTPNEPIGLEVAKIFQAKSYFMLGKNLPGSPPPPTQVTEILGNINLDYMRDMNALQSGTGFAFGLHFIVDTGDLRFLMFYGRFAAGTGVDFMLKDYGTEVHCEGSSGPVGINGWYANGQAYAFVMGKIGIKVNLRFYKGSFDILSIGAAAVLQAKGPNPFWMKGVVGGYYRILGGMVKGQCRFEVTVGKDCRIMGEQNLLEDMKMIAEMSPSSGSKNVDVFNTPQIAFNIPVGEVFEIRDMEGQTHHFRAMLDEFVVVNDAQPIQGQLQWNNERDVVVFDGHDILPGEKTIEAKARLTFEELKNGVWSKVTYQGKIVEEIEKISFSTGKAPDYIPEKNVSYSYPMIGQLNFLPRESTQGYIQLRDGQPYLFKPGSEWIQKVRVTDESSSQYLEADFTYTEQTRRISFTMPQGFQNAKTYRFEIVNIPRHTKVLDANVQKIETEIQTSEEAGTATLTTKEIEGERESREIKSIYTSVFRTSKYNTFREKMNAITLGQTFINQTGTSIFLPEAKLDGDERFDKADAEGVSEARPLIQMEAILQGNRWYESFVFPLVYEGYPLLGWIKVTQRANPQILGLPPVRDVHFGNIDNSTTIMTEVNSLIQPVSFTYEKVVYNLPTSVYMDFKDIQRQAVNYVVNNPGSTTPRLQKLVTQTAPLLKSGTYKIRVSYLLPGSDTPSSTYEWELYNRLSDY